MQRHGNGRASPSFYRNGERAIYDASIRRSEDSPYAGGRRLIRDVDFFGGRSLVGPSGELNRLPFLPDEL